MVQNGIPITNSHHFLLTGSQIFQLMEGVTESLAGRIAILHLYPFNLTETLGARPKLDLKDPIAAADQIVRGFYPELIQDPSIDASHWYESYITTYLERDVRNIRNIADLSLFERFVGLLATRVGGLLNLSEISKECGVSHGTARSWVSILESTYTIFLLRPYFKNRSKRLVKSPKLYFVDTGLLCTLLGTDSGERFLRASEGGQLFENMVVMEWLKRESLRTSRPRLYFYRDAKGHEVDLLVERGDDLLAFEIKQAKSVTKKMVGPLERFLGDHPTATGYLLSLREEAIHLSRNVEAIHWSDSFQL